MLKRYFITGIGTDVGKTIVSAVLTEKLKADYWKPVQSGDLHNSDTMKVQKLVSNKTSVFHPEAYRLTQPFSPHKSAAIDGIDISIDAFGLPQTDNTLIIEGAGGLMVPLNDKHLVIDLMKKLDAEVILVSQNYLGSINHTLLSAVMLKQYGLPVSGIIFNGEPNQNSEDYILQYTGFALLGHIPQLTALSANTIREAGNGLLL